MTATHKLKQQKTHKAVRDTPGQTVPTLGAEGLEWARKAAQELFKPQQVGDQTGNLKNLQATGLGLKLTKFIQETLMGHFQAPC